jgi:YNFM family putative membrane transporter
MDLPKEPTRDASSLLESGTPRAQASALYLFCYYLGSSAVGTIGGLFWSASGWPSVVGLVSALLVLALATAFRLATLPPVAPEQA